MESAGCLMCTKCGEVKLSEAFASATYTPGAVRQPCRECYRAYRREYYANSDGAAKAFARMLRTRHGMSMAEYEAREVNQGGVCALCWRAETVANSDGRGRRLAVDPDPNTHTVRGLLCQRCVRMVWCIKESGADPDYIRAYLEGS